jgi:hypothetical protein
VAVLSSLDARHHGRFGELMGTLRMLSNSNLDRSPGPDEGRTWRDEADVEVAKLLAESGVLPEQAT